MTNSSVQVRDVALPNDIDDVRKLWFDYLTWGNNEMQSLYGVHPHDPEIAVEQDILLINKFLPPNGRLILAIYENKVCLRNDGCHGDAGPDVHVRGFFAVEAQFAIGDETALTVDPHSDKVTVIGGPLHAAEHRGEIHSADVFLRFAALGEHDALELKKRVAVGAGFGM